MKRAAATRLGRLNVQQLIRLADLGNPHAAAWLRDIARREVEGGTTCPLELAAWLARPPYKRGKGRPTEAATASTAHDALEHERMIDMAAWAAWWNVRAGMKTSAGGDAGDAFTDVADWLSEVHGVHVGGSAIRRWFYERRDAMDRQHAEVETLAAAL